MFLIQPSATLLACTPDPQKVIETAARTCYKSTSSQPDDEGSAGAFCGKLIRSQHTAMLEHASATFLFVTDRGISHEIVRHRLASFAQESTRFCDYTKSKFHRNISFIVPPDFTFQLSRVITHDGTSPIVVDYKTAKVLPVGESVRLWLEAMLNAEFTYYQLREIGASPEEARGVLPNDLKTEIVVTANMREWRHIFNLRVLGTTGRPHPRIRKLMGKALEVLFQLAPGIFEDQYKAMKRMEDHEA